MNFLSLESSHKKWREILVIGKTIERNNKKYHLVGMTLDEEAKLYMLEPYDGSKEIIPKQKGVNNQRKQLKAQKENDFSYMNCSDFSIGGVNPRVQGGCGGSLEYALHDCGIFQLFFDMMSVGWVVPEWLKKMEWNALQLVTLDLADVKELPKYSPKTPISIKHRPDPLRHTIEKAITLNVGKSSTFRFTDDHGDKVQCYINGVTLIDVWKTTEEQFNNPQLADRLSPEELQQAKDHCYAALEESCPKGMCYIGIEYECSKNMGLQFYSREYLVSRPDTQKRSASSMLMGLKPDNKTGIHQLPLKGCVIQTAVPADTSKIPAELFFCFEMRDAWEEDI